MFENPFVRSSLGRSRLEEDDFVINDVGLSIPPTQIHIEKQSFHYEWQTLRTRTSQQIKSGHGKVTVSVNCIIKDLRKLTELVAGLRATPFCVVQNKYIENQLGSIHTSNTLTTYKQFQPIVLAMTSMTFSTMGHEGYVDCVSAQLDFVYFNYFPYTPVFCFKTGPNNMSPGPAWQSGLWKAFYKPYLDETQIPTGLQLNTEPSDFVFNEYALISDTKKNTVTKGSYNEPAGWDYIPGNDTAAQASKDGQVFANGGFRLYGRKRRLTLSPDNDAIIQQVTISFQNILATIPMIGYTYPTFQHVGSVDASVLFVVNCSNTAAGAMQHMYDSLEKTNLEYRQIPQGFRNLFVSNNFLRLFGITEFIVKGISSGTIPEQPGRSNVVLELEQAGVTTKTFLDDPEGFRQEYVASSTELQKEIYKVLGRYLRQTNSTNPELYTASPWYLEIHSIVQDTRNKALWEALEQARNLHNEFLDKAYRYFFWHNTVRQGGFLISFAPPEQERRMLYENKTDIFNAVLKIAEEQFGYTPGFGDIQKRLLSMYQTPIRRLTKGSVHTGTINQPAASGNKIDDKLLETALADCGFFEYQKGFSRLFLRIKEELLGLDEFQHLANYKDSLGLDRGLVAYPDFIPQLRSVAAYGSASSSVSDGSLTEYDPDAYLWYPIYDGSASTAVFGGLVDTNLMNIARQQSIEAFNNAQGTVGDFFQRNYKLMLKRSTDTDTDRGKSTPYDILESNLEKYGGNIHPPFYSNMKTTNATRSDTINHLVVPDPSKATTNWYPKRGEQLLSPNELTHSTDLMFMWDGVEGGVADDSPPLSTDKSIQPGQGKQSYGSGDRLGVTDMRFGGPRPFSPQVAPSQGFLCPIATWTDKMDGGCLGPRDIGKGNTKTRVVDGKTLTETIVDPKFYASRLASAKYDWDECSASLTAAGYASPYSVEKELGIPWEKLTLEQYQNWKKKHRRVKGVGYVHKGIDLAAPIGTNVYAIADGVLLTVSRQPQIGCGIFIEIQHTNGYVSRYIHLQDIDPILKKNDRVKAGQCIAISGRSGQTDAKPMGPHLHFELWQKWVGFRRKGNVICNPNQAGIAWMKSGSNPAKRFSPPAGSPIEKRASDLATRRTPKDTAYTLASPMKEAINEMQLDILRGQGQTLLRAYPTFKLYFIEDDSGERKRLAFDDFFSYNAVKSIRVIRSREIAADLCVLELTNISGILSNRKFRQETYKEGTGDQIAVETQNRPRDASGNIVKETTYPANANTTKENPIASLLLQEGIQISLRLGYSSDPDRLETVFNGVITGVEFSDTDDLVQVVAQSFAVELVQDIKGLESPDSKKTPWWSFWGLKDNASTGRILEEMMASPELLHFGRWVPTADNVTKNRDLLTNKWQFRPHPEDDNIFPPNPKDELEEIGDGLVMKDLTYIIYRTTIWDIFKEMELRHPNFIASPVPYKDYYGERMTMFYGLPHQLYFARHPSIEEQRIQNKLIAEQADLQAKKEQTEKERRRMEGSSYSFAKVGYDPLVPTLPLPKSSQFDSQVNRLQASRLDAALSAGFIKPFRKYHLITSTAHIITNNIQTNSKDVANTVVVSYPATVKVDDDKIATADPKVFLLKQDNAIPAEDTRTCILNNMVNISNENLAKRYALATLCQSLKKAYRGEITIIGNPRIKPYDVCLVADSASDMVGPIEVRQVTHLFSQETGFITEVVPDMLAMASDWSLLTSCQAMGIVAAGMINKMTGFDKLAALLPEGAMAGSSTKTALSVIGAIYGGMQGCVMSNMILNFTQLGHPVIIAPLAHHGRVFAGGIPTRKIPSSIWKTMFGKWTNDVDSSFNDWLEEWYDDLVSMVKKSTFQKTQGSFFHGFSGNTLKVE